ncbi:hypothetical protein CKA32_003322 [Geitlerinema sp. FC II]|nr:hypothetical protein CKA32_003322 [Geitlerinema sp. FC II]
MQKTDRDGLRCVSIFVGDRAIAQISPRSPLTKGGLVQKKALKPLLEKISPY